MRQTTLRPARSWERDRIRFAGARLDSNDAEVQLAARENRDANEVKRLFAELMRFCGTGAFFKPHRNAHGYWSAQQESNLRPSA